MAPVREEVEAPLPSHRVQYSPAVLEHSLGSRTQVTADGSAAIGERTVQRSSVLSSSDAGSSRSAKTVPLLRACSDSVRFTVRSLSGATLLVELAGNC